MPDEPDADAVRAFEAARDARDRARSPTACARSGRDPGTVRLVAVSKTVPAERVRAAVAAGQLLFGENRVQEAEAKVPAVGAGEWHLIGPLQDNKARRALEIVRHDRVRPLRLRSPARLDRIVRELGDLPADGPVPPERRYPVLLQVNVDGDPGKAGFAPDGGRRRRCRSWPRSAPSRLDGLMTIGRLVDDPEAARPTFRALRDLAGRLRARDARPRAGAVDGHERRLPGRGGGGRDARPGRPGAVRGPPRGMMAARPSGATRRPGAIGSVG